MNSDIKIIIRKLVPLFSIGIYYLLTLLPIRLSDYIYPWVIMDIPVLVITFMPLIIYSYIYMWMYDRLRQKYKRWKIISISFIGFLTLLVLNENVSITFSQIQQDCLEYSMYMIPFAILLLGTDKYANTPLKTKTEFYKLIGWLSPIFAAFISSFLEGIRFWTYQWMFSPPLREHMEDMIPYDIRFWAYHLPMLVVAWVFIIICNATKNSHHRLFFRMIGIGILSIVIYWNAAFNWKDYYFGIWGIIRFEIPFLILFFTAQKHIK